jgi:hypothetical protein
MATRAGVGISHHHSPSIAGREAAKQALENAGLDKPDFVFMFASVGYDQRSLLRAVREATGGAPLCGCSGEGTINGDDADESDFSVVVMGISPEDLRWHNGLATGLRADSHATCTARCSAGWRSGGLDPLLVWGRGRRAWGVFVVAVPRRSAAQRSLEIPHVVQRCPELLRGVMGGF